uniref:C2H2-type domain-containing protein n=1 Tax=Haemonchus placei TaxID=6290 RepID=A0A0N4WKZ5_HAEPC
LLQVSHVWAPISELLDDKSIKKRRVYGDTREMKKAHSLDSDEPYDNLGDVIIPSTDKEGWCRNKKYIEKTDGGFMCMVCKKVYGRYNSVSYHVTIYHRNPPIKCDLPGCQFTTREARYIHFHKYYRHGIPLPDSIDQGSRRCPHCRHVSKSPAMLEKHIRRHQIVETRYEVFFTSIEYTTAVSNADNKSRSGVSDVYRQIFVYSMISTCLISTYH